MKTGKSIQSNKQLQPTRLSNVLFQPTHEKLLVSFSARVIFGKYVLKKKKTKTNKSYKAII